MNNKEEKEPAFRLHNFRDSDVGRNVGRNLSKEPPDTGIISAADYDKDFSWDGLQPKLTRDTFRNYFYCSFPGCTGYSNPELPHKCCEFSEFHTKYPHKGCAIVNCGYVTYEIRILVDPHVSLGPTTLSKLGTTTKRLILVRRPTDLYWTLKYIHIDDMRNDQSELVHSNKDIHVDKELKQVVKMTNRFDTKLADVCFKFFKQFKDRDLFPGDKEEVHASLLVYYFYQWQAIREASKHIKTFENKYGKIQQT